MDPKHFNISNEEQEIVVVVAVEDADDEGEEQKTGSGLLTRKKKRKRKTEEVIGTVCFKPTNLENGNQCKDDSFLKIGWRRNRFAQPKSKDKEIKGLMNLNPDELAGTIHRRNLARDRQCRRKLQKKREAAEIYWVDPKDADHKKPVVQIPPPLQPKKTHPCHTCGHVFGSSSKLRMHQINYLGDDGLTCLNLKQKVKGFRCKFCGHSSQRLFNLRRHIQRKHFKEVKENTQSEGEKSNDDAETEKEQKSEENSLTKIVENNEKHIGESVEILEKDAKQTPNKICESRGKEVEKNLICSLCNKSFSKSYNLKRHSKTHTGDRPFSCVCGKSFLDSSHLANHERTHTKERNYDCSDCDLKFSRKTHLEDHYHIHTGHKRYKCDECLKSFTRSDTLRFHKLTHSKSDSDAFPYKCEVCGKRFRTPGNKRVHVKAFSKLSPKAHIEAHYKRISIRDKRYNCDICGKRYTRRDNLQLHKLTHKSGIEACPYKCEVCDKRFNNPSNKRKHIKTHSKS